MEAVNAVLPPGSRAVLSALADATGDAGGASAYGGLLKYLMVAAPIFLLTGGAAGLAVAFWRLVHYAGQ